MQPVTKPNVVQGADHPLGHEKNVIWSKVMFKMWHLPNWFRKSDRNSLKKDLLAGLTGAVIVLPQGVAFATIAGLPPQYGLYTAMVPAIIAALFGSSHRFGPCRVRR